MNPEPILAEAKLRILMISDVYFPRVNGVSTSIQNFRRCLQTAGHHVTLLAPDYGQHASADDGDIVRIPSRVVPMDEEDRIMNWRSLTALQSRLVKDRYDVVHVQTPFLAHYAGVRFARALGAPVVESYHTFFEEYLHHYCKFLPANFMRWVARRFSTSQCNAVDGLVVPSNPMLAKLRAYGISSGARVIPTGLNLAEFSGGDGSRFRQQHGIAADRSVMLYVGRVVFEKNIEFLLKMAAAVAKRMPKLLFIIAGEGPAVPHLKEMTNTLGIANNVMFIGYLERKQALLDCYRAADVFVFASRTETQGLVLLEAMALGVPVVSTAVLGTKDVLRDKCGCIITEESVTRFADDVTRVLSDAQLRARLSATAYAYAQEWNEMVFAYKLVEFYRQTSGAYQFAVEANEAREPLADEA